MSSRMARNILRAVLLVLGCVLVSGSAFGDVRFSGTWPDESSDVTLDISGASRADALRALAEAAGWSLVVHAPSADPVDIHVKDQPANKVLELLLTDGQYVASRNGDLVSVTRASAGDAVAAKDEEADDDAKDVEADDDAKEEEVDEKSQKRAELLRRAERDGGKDITVAGRNVTIAADQIAKDVTVTGGSIEVFGIVTGDLTVMGGSAHIHDSAHVMGDATAIGGSLHVEDGATVDGDVGVIGGILERGDSAIIGGDVDTQGGDDDEHEQSWVSRWSSAASNAITNTALLFAFGAVLLALSSRRMEMLKVEVATRPMRSFALGLVGLLATAFALVALCITVVGIPIAMVAVLALVFAGFASTCAALTTLGGAFASHRSNNVYVHLAVGCLAYLLIGLLPWVGGIAQMGIVLAGFGAVVATRATGLWPSKNKNQDGPHPYR